MQRSTMTGQIMRRGVVKEQRQVVGDVLNSTSPAHLSYCVQCRNRCIVRISVAVQRSVGETLEMNLYRNFGSLMEIWVSEENRYSDSALIGNNSEESSVPSFDTTTNLFSESVDSGVETASSDTSSPTIYSFVSTDNAETDVFIPEREVARRVAPSTSQSPESSSSLSSSLCLFPSTTPNDSTASKVEQVQERNEHPMNKPQRLTVEEVLRRRPRSLPKQNTSTFMRGQRSQSFTPSRTVKPTLSVRQMSLMWRRQSSMSCEKQRTKFSACVAEEPEATRHSQDETSGPNEERERGEERQQEQKPQDLCDKNRRQLSPGLSYLEHVCQMLEEVARQQMHNRALKMVDTLQEQQDTQSESEAAEEDLSSLKETDNTENVEPSTSEPEVQKDPYRNFRQRSASDTTIATLHLRNLKADCRGQHLSTCDLVEKEEKDHEKQRSKIKKNSNKNWKLKIWNMKRDESTRSSQQLPEKNKTQRRLSNLFRKRKISLPE